MKIKILVIVFISFIAIILLMQNFQTEEDNVILTKQPQTVEEFSITHKEANALKWDLTSKRAIIGENEAVILLDDKITIKIHSGTGVIVQAGGGTINREAETVIMKDGVVISMNDYTLTTNTLTWNGKDNTISTHDDIQLNGNNISVTGKGLVAHVKDKVVTIKNDVKAQLYK